jgi:hypothetical protein
MHGGEDLVVDARFVVIRSHDRPEAI